MPGPTHSHTRKKKLKLSPSPARQQTQNNSYQLRDGFKFPRERSFLRAFSFFHEHHEVSAPTHASGEKHHTKKACVRRFRIFSPHTRRRFYNSHFFLRQSVLKTLESSSFPISRKARHTPTRLFRPPFSLFFSLQPHAIFLTSAFSYQKLQLTETLHGNFFYHWNTI